MIEAVAIDMSPAYREAVVAHLSKAVIVFDHFQVIERLNDTLWDFLRALHCEATDRLHKRVLIGTRWLLLMNPENLDPKRDEKHHPEEAQELNKPLATAYYPKKNLRRFLNQPERRPPPRSFRTGSGGSNPRASACSGRWPGRWRPIVRGCWRTPT
jgi:transposase